MLCALCKEEGANRQLLLYKVGCCLEGVSLLLFSTMPPATTTFFLQLLASCVGFSSGR
jgi:hypothetical protein